MTPEAAAYLDEVLDFMQQHSMMKKKIGWGALRHEVLESAANAQKTADTYSAVRMAVKRLGDQHSFFLTPQEWQLWLEGKAVGTQQGLLVAHPEAIVVLIYPGSAAEQAGLRVGDRIETLNGKPAALLEAGEFQSLLQSSPLHLSIKRSNAILSITLSATTFRFTLMLTTRRLAGDVGYIELPGMIGDATAVKEYALATQQHMRELDQSGVSGWIVDLRRNTGGNMFPMLAGIGPLLGEGEPGSFVDVDGNSVNWSYRDGKFAVGEWIGAQVDAPYRLSQSAPPIAVLMSRFTRSSGELTALAFRGRSHTRSFGESTAGLPTANEGYVFSDGSTLFLTIALGADRTGQTYDSPLLPDDFVDADWMLFNSDSDPVLQAALQWLHRA